MSAPHRTQTKAIVHQVRMFTTRQLLSYIPAQVDAVAKDALWDELLRRYDGDNIEFIVTRDALFRVDFEARTIDRITHTTDEILDEDRDLRPWEK